MNYIKGFDGLRAISISFVILSHLGIFSLLPESDFFRNRFWLLFSGETGVLVFFNLSGFLISFILIREKINTGNINFKTFFIKRFLRLLPPYIMFSFSILVLKFIGLLNFTMEGFFMAFLYCYNYAPTKFYHDELVHTWSLAVEEQFYLIWPFIINQINIKKTFIFISMFVSICVIFLFLIRSEYFITFRRPDRWFIPSAAAILIGATAAIAINYEKVLISNFFKSKYSLVFGILIYLYPIFCIKYFLFLSPIIMSLGISSLIGWIYYHQNSKITNILNLKTIRYIGKISYSIYVYQGLFLKNGPGSNLFIQQFPQNFILTMLTAIISYEFLEKQFLKLKNKY